MPDPIDTLENDPTNDTLQKIWPTLFIAVGGTGMEIALRVRRRLLNYVWGSTDHPVRIGSLNEFPLAQFIHFDLDAGTNAEDGQAAATDLLSEEVKFSDDERLIFPLDLFKYSKTDGELNRYPLIADWFPLTKKKLDELKIDPSKGAGQIRSLSRLYFFDKANDLKTMVEGKIKALLAGIPQQDRTRRLGLDLQPASLRIVVIASTAGGTGAGSFLDMGYLTKWLARQQLTGAKVDLALMLPSGYSGRGKSRTEANTYAALMELEACTGHGLKFIRTWADNMDPELQNKPYDEVFLFDTGNLALRKTTQAPHVFDMVADILFEDFTSAEFANRKRSIAVNQSQYKIDAFSLPMDRTKYGSMKMTFSKAYSAFGQAIIDTQLEQKRNEIVCHQVKNILRVFFGMSSDQGGKADVPPPLPEDARSLLKKHAHCAREVFELTYDFIVNAKPYEKGLEFGTHALVSRLLYDNDKSIIGRVRDRINKDINDILSATEKDQRLARIDTLRKQLDRDLGIDGEATDPGARALENSIRDQRKRLYEKLVGDDDGLINALWAAVDNKERGGLGYTLQLIELLKDDISNKKTGLIMQITRAEHWFSGLCDTIKDKELQVLREHLNQTRGRGLFGFGNREAHAEAKLEQTGEAIRWYAEARLRAVAAREAAILLRDLAKWLGKHEGMDDNTGKKRWSKNSFAGKLVAFESLIRDITSAMDEEVERSREALKQDHPTYQIVKATVKELDEAGQVSPEQAKAWARTIFDNLGGAREIFKELKQAKQILNGQPAPKNGTNLILRLKNLVLAHLPSLGSGEENPLIQAFSHMSEAERRVYFENCLGMAMPWVEVNLEGAWTVDPDQYACVIGVSGAKVFEKKFGDDFKSALPALARMSPDKISFYETGVSGKLTCYVELSGVPLPALKMLANWKASYKEAGKKIPVHTHKDKTIFVHPIAPSAESLDRLADHFKTYIQGIVFNILKRRKDHLYCFKISGDTLAVGNERAIRMEGMDSEHLNEFKPKLTKAMDRIKTPAQVAGLDAIYDYYIRRVYPPRKIMDEDMRENMQKGFCNVMGEDLKKQTGRLLEKKYGTSDMDLSVLSAKLKDPANLDVWTDEVAGSESDVYEIEIGDTFFPKRTLRPEFFEPGWLESRFLPLASPKPATSLEAPGPVPAVGGTWWVALNRQKDGPHEWSRLESLIAQGVVTMDTKVWTSGFPKWEPAGQVDELAVLFHQPPPLEEDQPPPLEEGPPDIDGV